MVNSISSSEDYESTFIENQKGHFYGVQSHHLTPEYYESLESQATAPSRWFQGLMLSVFLLTFVMTLFAADGDFSSGLISGSLLSLTSVAVVLISYFSGQARRRHPNQLIFWRSIADGLFSFQILLEQVLRYTFFESKVLCNATRFRCGCSPLPGAHEVCMGSAGAVHFALVAAECWYLCTAVNVIWTLTNPFTDIRRNTRFFHVFSWGCGVLGAIIMIFNHGGYSRLGFCWWNSASSFVVEDPATCPVNATIAASFSYHTPETKLESIKSIYVKHLWIIAIVGVSLITCVWAGFRLSGGISETYALRKNSIRDAWIYVMMVSVYWVVLMILFIFSILFDAPVKHGILYESVNFLVASKGFLDLIVWFTFNDFRHTQKAVDISPQMNAALRRQILQYTTTGVAEAVRAASFSSHESPPLSPSTRGLIPDSVQVHSFLSSSSDKADGSIDWERATPDLKYRQRRVNCESIFYDYHPSSFRRVREIFHFNDQDYLESLMCTTRERLSEGTSGAFMFYTGDCRLIVKTISEREAAFLCSIAPAYAEYLWANPNSLLTRFYGCHCLELYGVSFRFVVMANVFSSEKKIHKRYDLKGSWINRSVKMPQSGDRATCRHCNHKFIFSSGSSDPTVAGFCPSNGGAHEPNVVFKDNDFTETLHFEPIIADQMYKQILQDTMFLRRFGIMDYSLLLGIHYDYATKMPSHCYVGIIDILQTWTFSKQLERLYKRLRYWTTGVGLSATHPKEYQRRFLLQMQRVLQARDQLQTMSMEGGTNKGSCFLDLFQHDDFIDDFIEDRVSLPKCHLVFTFK